MTSHKKLPVLVTLFLILGLFLVACERPLPGDGSGDGPDQGPPTGTELETYPAPGADSADDTGNADDTGSEYPAPDSELILPAEESSTIAEGYPAEEGSETGSDAVANEAAEGESTEGANLEGEAAEGEQVDSEPAEGETAEGEVVEGAAVESESSEGAAETDNSEGTAADEQPEERTHTVGSGDTLFSIGMQYGMSWVAIAEANDITNPDSLYIGQVLLIPDISATDSTDSTTDAGDSDSAETTESVETTEAAGAEETTADEVEAAETIHVVQSGENLYRISLKYGVNMMDVARANDLANFDDLAVGQELIIPLVSAAETEAEDNEAQTEEVQSGEVQAEEITHVVQESETIFGIAFKYGIAWTKLVERNDISSPYSLETGQILVIPAGE